MVRLVNDQEGFLRIRLDDSWVMPRAIYLRHNGEWRAINALNIMVDGTWRAVFVYQHERQAA